MIVPMSLVDYQKNTDEELASIVPTDHRAFVPLVRRYESKLLAYIRRISGFQKEDAEDILQDAFVDAYRHIAGFDPHLKFSSWIYRIVHNRTISAYRKHKSSFNNVSIDDEDMGFERLLAAKEESQNLVESSLNSKVIKQILDKLPPRDKEVLVLAYIEEKSYEEMSDILQAPIGTVGTWIRRARQKFAKLGDEYPNLIR
ncbi:MAG: RNA polymerase sigma factor [Patescibacteria group bacterium]|jgi:RNA polymerase sigma-70 factor (ECF subfamily)